MLKMKPCFVLYIKRSYVAVGQMVDQLPTVVSCQWLYHRIQDKNVENLVVLDATCSATKSDYEDYKKQHIPYAQFYDMERCVKPTPLIPRSLPEPKCFTEYVRNLGVSSATPVVMYDNSPSAPGFFNASRAWWLFKLHGHSQVSVLDGGLQKWISEGYKTSTEEPAVRQKSTDFKISMNLSMLRQYEDMVQNLQTCKDQIGDTRPTPFFTGKERLKNVSLKGHMPGAKSIPYNLLFDYHKKSIKSTEELKTIFEEAGLDIHRPIVTTCNTSMTACSLALAAHLLGMPISVYLGSWTEWGQRANQDMCVTDED